MSKQIHLRIDDDIANIILDKAKKDKKTINKIINETLVIGLNLSDMFLKVNHYDFLLNKLYSNVYYIKKLLQQSYSDLNLEKTNPSYSNNLNEFNKTFRKGNRMND